MNSALGRGALDHLEIVDELKNDYGRIHEALFKKYGERVGELREQLRRANPGRTKRGIERSVFSTLLQDMERQCLDALIESLASNGYETCVKIYDGCLVRAKDGVPMLPPEVLDAAAEHILAKTKIRMRCWEKCLLCGEIFGEVRL